MSWFTIKAGRISSYSSLCPLSLYKVDSSGCVPTIIDAYKWHSQTNANCMWALATLLLLPMSGCYILAFALSAFLSAPSNCGFNSFVFCVHKHRLFQNPLLLSSYQSSLYLFFFSMKYYYLPYLIALFLIMLYVSCVLIDDCPKHQNDV